MDILKIEDFASLLKGIEKLYFLILDEQNNMDFIFLLMDIKERLKSYSQLSALIELKISEKIKILIKIKKLRKETEKEISKIIKKEKQIFSLIPPYFLHFFYKTI